MANYSWRYRLGRGEWKPCTMLGALRAPYDHAERLIATGALEIERRVDGNWISVAKINMDGLNR